MLLAGEKAVQIGGGDGDGGAAGIGIEMKPVGVAGGND